MAGKIETLLKQANSSDKNDTSVTSAECRFTSEAECSDFFRSIKPKLFLIENWRGSSSLTNHEHFNETGFQTEDRPLAIGSFIRMTLYGTGKFDWVKVVSIDDGPDELVLTVQPTYDPTESPQEKGVVSHFFSGEARNNFCLQKHDKTVTFWVIGLDEKQNTSRTGGVLESARNIVVANLGSYLGAQKAMWTEFCKNFLKTDERKQN